MTTKTTLQGNISAKVEHYDSFFTITFSAGDGDVTVFFDKHRISNDDKFHDIATSCHVLAHAINQ